VAPERHAPAPAKKHRHEKGHGGKRG
jgi:hypothetical protein